MKRVPNSVSLHRKPDQVPHRNTSSAAWQIVFHSHAAFSWALPWRAGTLPVASVVKRHMGSAGPHTEGCFLSAIESETAPPASCRMYIDTCLSCRGKHNNSSNLSFSLSATSITTLSGRMLSYLSDDDGSTGQIFDCTALACRLGPSATLSTRRSLRRPRID